MEEAKIFGMKMSSAVTIRCFTHNSNHFYHS